MFVVVDCVDEGFFFIIDDSTKIRPRYRQEYRFGKIGEDRCRNR